MSIVKKILDIVAYNVRSLIYTILWFVLMLFRKGFTNRIHTFGKGREVLILGNGPSLRKEISSIKTSDDIDVLAVNNFCDSPYFHILKPSLYCLLDPAFFLDCKDKETRTDINRAIRLINEINWKMYLLVPPYFQENAKRIFVNTNISIITPPPVTYKGWKSLDKWLFAHSLSVPRSQNVLIGAISLALQTGYEKITLYGADHNWCSEIAVNEKNELCIIDRHFFDDTEPTLTPIKFGDGTERRTISHYMLCLYYVFEGYEKLRLYSDYMNKRVINRTKHSLIDAFDKV